MKKTFFVLGLAAAAVLASCGGAKADTSASASNDAEPVDSGVSKVYFIKDITPENLVKVYDCLLYTSPSPRDKRQSRMPSSA